jgi:hypothetical protein
MSPSKWQISLGVSFIALSVVLYLFQIYVFRTPRDTLFYLFQDVAFVPIQVLLVTLIINRLLSVREKRSRLEKLNMVIGAFFSEVGTQLLRYFSDSDQKREALRSKLTVSDKWSNRQFFEVSKYLGECEYSIEVNRVDLSLLRTFLLERREFLLRLLENPNLLEHESFTELLLAVFHLVEELAARDDMKHLPDSDLTHLAGDMKRAYILLVHQWLEYLSHLKDHYPYLFSLAIRMNPFMENASPLVKS